VPILNSFRRVSLSRSASHYDRVVWFTVLDKAINLQVVEHPKGFLTVMSGSANSDHIAQKLLVCV
jgi:hypothetical protein